MSRSCPRVLSSLVNRAATITAPFNSQDAILILRSLHSLRVPNSSVRRVCEKAAFALASAPRESIPVEVTADAMNALTALQAGSLPVVATVLAKRLADINTPRARPVSGSPRPQSSGGGPTPQTAQKAALVLMKLGRRGAPVEACDAVLRTLHSTIEAHPEDIALRLAYIGLYPYSSTAAQSLRAPSSGSIRVSLQTLLAAAQKIESSRGWASLTGNVSWQAFHLYAGLAHVEAKSSTELGIDNMDCETWLSEWQIVRRGFVGLVDGGTFPSSRLAEFIGDFSKDLVAAPGVSQFVLQPLLAGDSKHWSAATKYDLAKIATGLGTALSKDSTVAAVDTCKKVLASLLTQLRERQEADLDAMTLAAAWHLVAVIGRASEDAAFVLHGDIEFLGRVTVRRLIPADAASPRLELTDLTQLVWILSSLSRLGAQTLSPSTEELQSSALRVLSGSRIDRFPPRSLSQLWHALSQLWHALSCSTAASGRAPVDTSALIASLSASVCKTNSSRMDVADLGMLLGGAVTLLTRSVGQSSQLPVDAVTAVVQKVLSDGWHRAQLERTHGALITDARQLLVKHGVAAMHPSSSSSAILEGDALTPVKAFERLVASPHGGDGPLSETIKMTCARSGPWAEDLMTGRSKGYGPVLKCAEECQRSGCPVFFGPETDEAARAVFVIPVKSLIAAKSLSRTDAAHIVRLMADSFLRLGAVRQASIDMVRQIIALAVPGGGDESGRTFDAPAVPQLLFLLHANKNISASNKLFNRQQLTSLLVHTEAAIVRLSRTDEADDVSDDADVGKRRRPTHGQEVVRLARALVNSQIVSRIGRRSLRQPDALNAALRQVCEHAEKNSPGDTNLIMKLKLFCP